MAKVCYFTGRKTVSGNNRSHAMNQTKRAVKPNLQKVTVLIDGKPKKSLGFSSCFEIRKSRTRLINMKRPTRVFSFARKLKSLKNQANIR